ncbi:hypothetical protein SAMN02745117_01723 [Lampropedia hyalina DSM 16112]|uniref:Uncharacterized protein n=2 Tax=Lampropedia TaxID=198705 RepID=A0A1M5APF2_9BURK|nr:hypothetical protein SAMN02745117_01723 [Lampropedia hyalina DSM 16112]
MSAWLIMCSMTSEQTIIEIIAQHAHLSERDIRPDTALSWSLMSDINNDVCFALLANISTPDALACKTVAQYLHLVSRHT